MILTLARQVKPDSNKPDFLNVDVDKPKKPNLPLIKKVLRICELEVIGRIRKQKTAHGWHLIIRINKNLRPLEQLAVQAMCGDDPVRVAMNYSRYKHRRYRNLLFFPKVKRKNSKKRY